MYCWQSQSEGHLRSLMTYLDPKTNCIVVAGGDGTLMEVRFLITICEKSFCQNFGFVGYDWTDEKDRCCKVSVCFMNRFNIEIFSGGDEVHPYWGCPTG